MAGKLPLMGMGAYAAKKESEEQARRDIIKNATAGHECVECGEFGPFGDGQYNYCKDHLPPDFYAARDAAQAFTAEMRAAGKTWPPVENTRRHLSRFK